MLTSQWEIAGTGAMMSLRVTNEGAADDQRPGSAAATPTTKTTRNGNLMGRRLCERGLLWIDAVGGYLLCMNDAVTIGQSIPGTSVAIPILGDLSRYHATIHRVGEGYVLEPHSRCSVNGRPCSGLCDLHDGNELRLGGRVGMRFRRPHPLGMTARLEMISSHRMQPSVDGILLVAGSVMLGPDPRMHVVCRHWKCELSLAPTSEGAFRYRTVHRVEIDGRPAAAAGPLDWNERLSGDDFALAIERLE